LPARHASRQQAGTEQADGRWTPPENSRLPKGKGSQRICLYKFMENAQDRMKRVAGLFIERGFATSHTVNYTSGMGCFEWTRSGKSLQKHLRHLFDVPNVASNDVDGHDVIAAVALIIFGEPSK
jgi:hypothetical protein